DVQPSGTPTPATARATPASQKSALATPVFSGSNNGASPNFNWRSRAPKSLKARRWQVREPTMSRPARKPTTASPQAPPQLQHALADREHHGVPGPPEQVHEVRLRHVVVGDHRRQREEEDRDRDEPGTEAVDHRVQPRLRPLLARGRGDRFDHLSAPGADD